MAGLGIGTKNFTLLSNNQRSFSPVLHYKLVAMSDFHLIIFHQMISIRDCLFKLGYIKLLTKINQSYFDHSH